MKLAPRFGGPYSIVKQISSMTYQLQLPFDPNIHALEQISSMLNPALKLSKVANVYLIREVDHSGFYPKVVVAILATRIHHGYTQCLIQWYGWSLALATR